MFVDCETTERLQEAAALLNSSMILWNLQKEHRYPAKLVNKQTKHQIDLLHIHTL